MTRQLISAKMCIVDKCEKGSTLRAGILFCCIHGRCQALVCLVPVSPVYTGEPMRELCEQSDDYTQIGMELIRTEPSLKWIEETGVGIGFLASNHPKTSKGKIIYGQCEKVPDKYRAFIPYDFLVYVYEPNVIDFSTEQIRILLHHELLHVGVNQKAEPSYRINPHDIEDFNEIIDRYGIGWSE